MSKKRELIHELPSGKFRAATQEEINEAKRLEKRRLAAQQQLAAAQAELKAIGQDCKHVVCYDEEGIPYNIRHCVACGHKDLL